MDKSQHDLIDEGGFAVIGLKSPIGKFEIQLTSHPTSGLKTNLIMDHSVKRDIFGSAPPEDSPEVEDFSNCVAGWLAQSEELLAALQRWKTD